MTRMGDKPEFIVDINLDKSTFKQWMWRMRLVPINVSAPEFHEHSIYGNLPDLASHVRTLKNLGTKLRIQKGYDITEVFDKDWKMFLENIKT